ncbi:MAG: T9SS type A sorting domain-containing protein [Bacteroidetes bacterium]|nr:T9SS type A sorting domain-containing protein [Bacteroidota bacterium]
MYRNFSNTLIGDTWTGNAYLFLPNNLSVDGKIIRAGFPGSGVQMRGGWHGNDYIKYVAAHELGHYLFGGGHIFGVSNLAIMTGGPVWNSSRGMHSWERWKLNWLDYTDVNSNSTVTATDYMTTRNVYRASISSSEYYSFENREKISSHDWAGGKGVYIYHVSDYGYPPTIDVQCADGNWDFTINPGAYYPLSKSQPNVNGKNEMNYDTWLNGIEYRCILPYYYRDAAWGDNTDPFNLSYNNVYSPQSNPRCNSNFTAEITGNAGNNYNITFYFTDPYAGSPSKPQNLHFTGANPNHPSLAWNLNSEPDISSYKVYRNYDNSVSWDLAGTISHPTNTFIDYAVDYTKPIWAKSVKYYITAVDNTNKSSVPSDQVETSGTMILPSIQSQNFAVASSSDEVIRDFALVSNYPNPFNPTTIISFSVPHKSQIKLSVFDVLGREVSILADGIYETGKYEISFNASNLPSGIYFYNLTNGSSSITKKMLLIK